MKRNERSNDSRKDFPYINVPLLLQQIPINLAAQKDTSVLSQCSVGQHTDTRLTEPKPRGPQATLLSGGSRETSVSLPVRTLEMAPSPRLPSIIKANKRTSPRHRAPHRLGFYLHFVSFSNSSLLPPSFTSKNTGMIWDTPRQSKIIPQHSGHLISDLKSPLSNHLMYLQVPGIRTWSL